MSNGKKIDDREERKPQKALMKASIAEATSNIHEFRQRAACNGNDGGEGSDHSQSNTDSGRMIAAKVSGQREDDVHLGCREGSILDNGAPLAMGMVSSVKSMWWEATDVNQRTDNNKRSETFWNA